MSCFQGVDDRRSWWSKKAIDAFLGSPFRFHDFMSLRRFEEIMSCLRYASKQEPEFTDRFFEVRELSDSWNANMSDVFMPSWINCLDESMMVWLNEYTAPGFMVVPRKPHPFGNEWHSICCVVSGIMWCVELVEGDDHPREMGKPEYQELGGATVGLMLRMTRSIWHTGMCVVMDSGFCVLKGILEIAKKGVYGAALIKKRRYWPRGVPGDQIIRDFNDKEIGYANAIHRDKESRCGLPHLLFEGCPLCDEDYVHTWDIDTDGKEHKKGIQEVGWDKCNSYISVS